MKRGPIPPVDRDLLWRLLRDQPDLFERGLRVVLEDLDCAEGALPAVDGLAVDAAGRPVLLFVAWPREVAIAARVQVAHAFVQRNGPALARALPEVPADFTGGARFLVVAVELCRDAVEGLRRLGLEELEAHELETFRVAGQDRILVRTLLGSGPGPKAPAGALPATVRAAWDELVGIVRRLDPGLRLDGDRYSRRVLLGGRLLCEFWCEGDGIGATLPGAPPVRLQGSDQVRAFGDRLMRRYLDLLTAGQPAAAGGPAEPAALRAPSLDAIRAFLAASRLTREEYSALGEPAGGQGPLHGG